MTLRELQKDREEIISEIENLDIKRKMLLIRLTKVMNKLKTFDLKPEPNSMKFEDYLDCVNDWVMKFVVEKKDFVFDKDAFLNAEEKLIWYIKYLHKELNAIVNTLNFERFNEKDFVVKLGKYGYNTFDV